MIKLFLRHRVAANLLMLIMILIGVFATLKINTQFLPEFNIQIITINISWVGASAEDVERSIINPIEQELRGLEHVKNIDSIAQDGSAAITLEFRQNANMTEALERVKQRVSMVRNLPEDAEQALIERPEFFEIIAKLVIHSAASLQSLRSTIYQIEQQLLQYGIAKIDIIGLPKQEIAIQVPIQNLSQLDLNLNDIATRIQARSQDLPAGLIGREEVEKQIRAIGQKRTVTDFKKLPIIVDENGQFLLLGDIATIDKRDRLNEPHVFYQGQPAVIMTLSRAENSSTLKAANALNNWLINERPKYGSSIDVHPYFQAWQWIKERINLLLKNGFSGLILILIILFFFLNKRVAFWIALGIPVSFLAALALLYFWGGSINMVSLFAFIMTLGIIVDDTIVVGEETVTQMQQGHTALQAANIAAHKMLLPIVTSSLTTVCAFIPLLFVSGIVGKILLDIPFVVICVIFASLIECFFVLPAHLANSFDSKNLPQKAKLRDKIDNNFEKFKNNIFKPFVIKTTQNAVITTASTVAIFIVALAVVVSGRINFTFFPSPDGTMIHANVTFWAGTAPLAKEKFMQKLQAALSKTDREISAKGSSLIVTAIMYQHVSMPNVTQSVQEESIEVELISPEQRNLSSKQFIHAWQKNITLSPGVEKLVIAEQESGPPGQDISIQLNGHNINQLKQAAENLKSKLASYNGVSNITDNLTYGREQLIYILNPLGQSLGLTTHDIGRQLQAAFTGNLAQIFYDNEDEIEVRVILPDAQRFQLNVLNQLNITTATGEVIPLHNVVDFKFRRGFDIIRHHANKMTVSVTASVDTSIGNANKIMQDLQQHSLTQLKQDYNVNVSFSGKTEDQAEILQDMFYGLLLAIALIYIVLAWSFSSYSKPIIIMAIIPFGLTGAILGHLVMQSDLTLFSLFGFFGLTGIVVNDAIILIARYQELLREGIAYFTAIIEAACQRLRAVILTSLTTIAGLAPLLFEQSLQAQFLIPMAISLCFGLLFATLLVLVLIPALLHMFSKISVGKLIK